MKYLLILTTLLIIAFSATTRPPDTPNDFTTMFNKTYELSQQCSTALIEATTKTTEDQQKFISLVKQLDFSCSYTFLGSYLLEAYVNIPVDVDTANKGLEINAVLLRFKEVLHKNDAKNFPIFKSIQGRVRADVSYKAAMLHA